MVSEDGDTTVFIHPRSETNSRVKIFVRIKEETHKKLEAYAKKTRKKKGEVIDLLVESLIA